MKRWILVSTLAVAAVLLIGTVTVWLGIRHLSAGLPEVDSIRQLQLSVPLRIVSHDDKLIGEFGAERRALLRYDEIPPNVVHAFLAAEDDRFFEHPGVDWQGLARAAFKLASSGEKSQGGSTITMQLARNVFLSNERTFTRKFKEILLALRIEDELSKKEILELYLNKIFLGERAYGVGAASLVYFGKDIHDLSLGEIATIAGLPKAPSRDNPVANPERARARRDYVLSRMRALGFISPEEYDAARAEPMVVRPYQVKVDVDAQYVAEMARAWAVERYGDDAYSRGLTIVTTIDGAKQTAANAGLRRSLLEYDERHGYRGPEGQLAENLLSDPGPLSTALNAHPPVAGVIAGAVMSFSSDEIRLQTQNGVVTLDKANFAWANLGKKPLVRGDIVRIRKVGDHWRLAEIPSVQGAFVGLRPQDGAIEALVGGFDFYANKFNRVMQARRQAGSGFKPFLYAAGLAYGFTPASIFLDAPVVFDDPSVDSSWRPENFEGDLKGPMSLREALVHSRNLVSIRLLQAIGIDYTRQYVPRFGLPADRLPNDLTMALGSAVFTPLEMARGYATIANGGFLVDPYLIAEVRDSAGQVLYAAKPKRACLECVDATLNAANSEGDTDAGAAAAPPAPVTPADDLAPRTIEPQVDWLIADMMHDVATRGTGAQTNALGRSDLAGKTGTTNDETDAWFSGFQNTQVGVAWVGFDQPTPLGRGEVGARAALPIWIDYMRTALKGVPQARLPRPPGLVEVRVNPQTGKLAAAGSANAVFETVQQDHIPEAETSDARHDPNKADLEDLY